MRYCLPVLSVLAILIAGTPAAAQEAQPPVMVEILGLRTWTRQMVEDSVAKYRPGISLADHSCAVILRDSVGFADAASSRFQVRGDTTWLALSVIEPDLRDRVRFRVYPEARPPVPEWAGLREVLEKDPQAMEPLQDPGVLLEHADSAFGRPLPDETRELRRRLRTHATARDWTLAREVILSDSSYENRAIAALVLSNFPERDSTYYLLAEGLRAKDSGASAAELVLSALTRDERRPVIPWAPAKDALSALIGGTNLFAYTKVLHVLVDTGIDPALGRELARQNPGLLLDSLGARNRYFSGAAHRFLTHIRGEDLGRDRATWEQWLSSAS
jgi:hypothetical protein